MHIAYKSQTRLSELPEKTLIKANPVKQKPLKGKSIYILTMENGHRKAALKKYAARIAAIQEVFPDWQPTFKMK